MKNGMRVFSLYSAFGRILEIPVLLRISVAFLLLYVFIIMYLLISFLPYLCKVGGRIMEVTEG